MRKHGKPHWSEITPSIDFREIDAMIRKGERVKRKADLLLKKIS